MIDVAPPACRFSRPVLFAGCLLVWVAGCSTPMRKKNPSTDGAATGGATGGVTATGGALGTGGVIATGGAIDAHLDPAVDAHAPCTPPSVGSACTPEQIPCDTCCTDQWSCADGAWQKPFLLCLPGPFTCGDQECMAAESYCRVTPAVSGGELPHPAFYRCETLPAPCHGRRCPTCDCLAEAGLTFTSCTSDALGAVYVTQ